MHIVGVLALVFAVVFGLIGFTVMMSMNDDIAALATGGLAGLMALFPAFWMLLVGFIVIAAAIAAAKLLD